MPIKVFGSLEKGAARNGQQENDRRSCELVSCDAHKKMINDTGKGHQQPGLQLCTDVGSECQSNLTPPKALFGRT